MTTFVSHPCAAALLLLPQLFGALVENVPLINSVALSLC